MLHYLLILFFVSNSAFAFVRREADVNAAACSGQLCKNGGTLQVTSNSFSCSCPSGYTGDRCEQNACDGLCKNGGTLQVKDNSISCSCPTGYTGTRCESEAVSCKNGATMVRNADGSISCTCPANYYGTYCEKSCPSGFTLLPKTGKPVGCYNFVNTAKVFTDAQKNCNSMGATSTLIVVDNAEEQSAVKSYITGSSVPAACGNQYFAAGQRIKVGDCSSDFVWKPFPDKTQPLVYKDGWGKNVKEPDCGTGQGERESCITFWSGVNWDWNDGGCNIPACSVCEVPL